MTENYRRHHASREIIFVPVEVPVAGPSWPMTRKPGPYKYTQREAWRPSTRPPSKAEGIGRYLDAIAKQERDVRAFQDAARAASHAPNS
jgi:hypothetical protein